MILEFTSMETTVFTHGQFRSSKQPDLTVHSVQCVEDSQAALSVDSVDSVSANTPLALRLRYCESSELPEFDNFSIITRNNLELSEDTQRLSNTNGGVKSDQHFYTT